MEAVPEVASSDVEAALAIALMRASAAKEWALVAQLARELEARRQGNGECGEPHGGGT
jgi:hypothetical protein